MMPIVGGDTPKFRAKPSGNLINLDFGGSSLVDTGKHDI